MTLTKSNSHTQKLYTKNMHTRKVHENTRVFNNDLNLDVVMADLMSSGSAFLAFAAACNVFFTVFCLNKQLKLFMSFCFEQNVLPV